MKQDFRLLGRFLAGYRLRLALVATASVAQAALLVPLGLILRQALDRTIPRGATPTLVLQGLAILALALISAGLAMWIRHGVLRLTKAAVERLRVELLVTLQRRPAAYFDRTKHTALHSSIVQDTERVDTVAAALAAQFVPGIIVGGGIAAALLVLSPVLFAIVAMLLVATPALSRRLGRVVRLRTRTWHTDVDRYSARIDLALAARRLIAAHAVEADELASARRDIAALRASGHAMSWSQYAYGQTHGLVGAVAGVGILVAGGALVIDGSITLGTLISFFALLGMLRGQAGAASAGVPQLLSGGESLRRLARILDADAPQPYRGGGSAPGPGPIVLENVTFGYEPDRAILRGLDLELNPGEIVVVTGPNGSGKSTLLWLILGLYRPWSGRLLASGVPYDSLDLTALRSRAALVPQDWLLLPASVLENIAFLSDVSPERAREAARLAAAADFAEALPEGYDSLVGDGGSRLSGGEGQRIALARAFARQATLLILDEPTSRLDRQGSADVLRALRSLPQAPAVLIASHDPLVIAAADRTLDLVGHEADAPLPGAPQPVARKVPPTVDC